jgi:hypothetical protein
VFSSGNQSFSVSSSVRCSNSSFCRVMAVVTELPLRLITSDGSSLPIAARAARVLGKTTPGS